MSALRIGLLGMLAFLGACASTALKEREAARLAEFERYAGAPVEEIRAFQLRDFTSLGDTRLVVWTGVNRAYLLRLRAPCTGLEFQERIAITSTHSVVSRRFDTVRFEREQCRIDEIRPVDYKALKQARRAAKDES